MDIESAVVVTDGQQWEKDLPELGDLEVLVAPWENPAFERAMQKGIKALPAALRADNNIDPGAYYRVVGAVMAKTVLFGWRNFSLAGVDTPFDVAYAQKLLVDPKYKPFRDGVVAAAKRVQLGIKVEQDQLLGNSSTSSSGSGTGEVTSSA